MTPDDLLLSDTKAKEELTLQFDDDLCTANLDFEYFMNTVGFEFDDDIDLESEDNEDDFYQVRKKHDDTLMRVLIGVN